MRLKIDIGIDNDAFQDNMVEVEVARILKRFCDDIMADGMDVADGLTLLDRFGNSVGYSMLKEEENW